MRFLIPHYLMKQILNHNAVCKGYHLNGAVSVFIWNTISTIRKLCSHQLSAHSVSIENTPQAWTPRAYSLEHIQIGKLVPLVFATIDSANNLNLFCALVYPEVNQVVFDG